MPETNGDFYEPAPEHHFTFGLWTVGNPGRDPFGDPVRAPVAPVRIVETAQWIRTSAHRSRAACRR
jgi:hypothetical protein